MGIEDMTDAELQKAKERALDVSINRVELNAAVSGIREKLTEAEYDTVVSLLVQRHRQGRQTALTALDAGLEHVQNNYADYAPGVAASRAVIAQMLQELR